MASRYSLRTLLAIVVPISAVLLLCLLLLVITCCLLVKQKAHIHRLNEQAASSGSDELFNLRKKQLQEKPLHRTQLQVPWYQKILFCGCCIPDVEKRNFDDSSRGEKGPATNGPVAVIKGADVSRHNSKHHQISAPQIYDKRHEMEVLPGAYDPRTPAIVRSGSTKIGKFGLEPRNNSNDADVQSRPQSSNRHSNIYSKYVDAPDSQENTPKMPEAPEAPHTPIGRPNTGSTVGGDSSYKYLHPHTTKSTSSHGEFMPHSKHTVVSSNTSSPKDILPPAPLNLSTEGVLLSDDETANRGNSDTRYYQNSAESSEPFEQQPGQSWYAQQGNPQSGQRSSGKSTVMRERAQDDRFESPESQARSPLASSNYRQNTASSIIETPTLDVAEADEQRYSKFKWLQPPVNLTRVQQGEHKMSMIASYVEPLSPVTPTLDSHGKGRFSATENSAVLADSHLSNTKKQSKYDPMRKPRAETVEPEYTTAEPTHDSQQSTEPLSPRTRPVPMGFIPIVESKKGFFHSRSNSHGEPSVLNSSTGTSTAPDENSSPSAQGAATSASKELDREHARRMDCDSTDRGGYGTEWHRNRADTESTPESEYTHGTYATAPSRAPYEGNRDRNAPILPGNEGLDPPWRTRRSHSTSSRTSSLLFSISDKGNTTGSSRRRRTSYTSSTRTKDPSKLNKPLPMPPGNAEPSGTSSVLNSPNTTNTNTTGTSTDQVPRLEDGVVANMNGKLFHAVFPYQPSLDDELPLKPKDIVRVYQVFDDGWCFARKERPKGGIAHGICPKVCLATGATATADGPAS